MQLKCLLSNTNYFFAIPFFINEDTLYRYNDLLNRCARLTDETLMFKDSQVVQVKSDLLAFRPQGPVITVTRFSRISVDPATGKPEEPILVETLAPVKKRLSRFALCADPGDEYRTPFVYITGGAALGSANAFTYDLSK